MVIRSSVDAASWAKNGVVGCNFGWFTLGAPLFLVAFEQA
ncbi:putative membrane protein [Synechococcus sp. A15-60]|nr:putative membrane protein [Synechococcus sp. A15-60]